LNVEVEIQAPNRFRNCVTPVLKREDSGNALDEELTARYGVEPPNDLQPGYDSKPTCVTFQGDLFPMFGTFGVEAKNVNDLTVCADTDGRGTDKCPKYK
jgi:hypothetical protein